MDVMLCYEVSKAPGVDDSRAKEVSKIVSDAHGVHRMFHIDSTQSIDSSKMVDFVLKEFPSDVRKKVLFVLAKSTGGVFDTTKTFEELGVKKGQIIEVYLTVC